MINLTKLAAPALAAAMAFSALAPAQAHDTGHGFTGDRYSSHSERYANGRDRHDFRPSAYQAKRFSNGAIRAEINLLRHDIEKAAILRQISWREAASLRSEARELDQLYWRYAPRGLSWREAASLDRKITQLRMALRIDMHDRHRHRG